MVLFLDANVPMYASGGDHPLKGPCSRVLQLVAARPDAFVTNAEVLQELLHRYIAVGRRQAGSDLVLEFAALMGQRVEPVFVHDVQLAALLASRYAQLSSRDLLHLAVMRRIDVDCIVTADGGFDDVAGFRRIDPAHVDRWSLEFGLVEA